MAGWEQPEYQVLPCIECGADVDHDGHAWECSRRRLDRPNVHQLWDLIGVTLLGQEGVDSPYALDTTPVQEHELAAVLHELARWYSATYPECAGCGHEPHEGKCTARASDSNNCTCPTGWLTTYEVDWE